MERMREPGLVCLTRLPELVRPCPRPTGGPHSPDASDQAHLEGPSGGRWLRERPADRRRLGAQPWA